MGLEREIRVGPIPVQGEITQDGANKGYCASPYQRADHLVSNLDRLGK